MKRLAQLAALLVLELLVITIWLDAGDLMNRAGLPGLIGSYGPWVLRGSVGFAAAFVAFALMQAKLDVAGIEREVGVQPMQLRWLYLHAVSALAFGLLSSQLFPVGGSASNLLAVAWVAAGLAALTSAAYAFLPGTFWKYVVASTGPVWLYAGVVAALALASVRLSQSMWQSAARLTFRLVEIIVRPIYPDLQVQPEILRLRAPNFGVIIDQACSGLEGAGLMIVFAAVWLILFRKDFRFPRSLLLVPVGVVTLFLLNAFRIAALLIIGNAGAREIATGGFHSQAGWIAFNGVALAMAVIVPRVNWFRSHPAKTEAAAGQDNPTAAYLLPFLAILAAGMLARAASAEFEWLYFLRVAAAGVALWMFRATLKQLDWRISWQGPVVGVAIFFMWIGLDMWNGVPTAGMPAVLAGASSGLQYAWIAVRVLGAVLTVPIAEELAFRGYLARRLTDPDFESVAYTQIRLLALVASSVAFGLMHGDRWIAGTVAGLAYALAAKSTNRLSEATVAHMTTNAILASFVLTTQQWQYW